MENVLLTTLENLPGMDIEQHFGLVTGNAIRGENIFKHWLNSWRNFFGGELTNFSRILDDTRGQAINMMIKEAENLGANAVINIRFESTKLSNGTSEVYVYGTAVRAIKY